MGQKHTFISHTFIILVLVQRKCEFWLLLYKKRSIDATFKSSYDKL